MPYILPEYRPSMDRIVEFIGEELDILGDKVISIDKIKHIAQIMALNVVVDGDLNYILYAVCKRYVKPSYNNYKKYITKLRIDESGDLTEVIREFYGMIGKKKLKWYEHLYKDETNWDIYFNLVGELECCKLEIYRRLIAPYEDKKIIENSDVE